MVNGRGCGWVWFQVGDQILRVNGFPVSTAVHHEVLALMRLGPHLHLKVRSKWVEPGSKFY